MKTKATRYYCFKTKLRKFKVLFHCDPTCFTVSPSISRYTVAHIRINFVNACSVMTWGA